MTEDIFQRTELLVGDKVLRQLAGTRVIIFGVGGVGSWCAEGLVRTGVTHLTIVDSDLVSATNVNRQDMATSRTIGQVKVEAMKERLLEINPSTQITAIKGLYSPETADDFNLNEYDFVVDAIDSLKDKAFLILKACESSAKFFASMGAALKIDPTRIHVAEFWNVRGCPLAAAIRKKFKKNGTLPAKKFLCVYDDEVLPNLGAAIDPDSAVADGQPKKAVINGTTMPVTAIFGLTLAGLIIKDIYDSAQ
jgi:tRNA A37 threonylcarbamoyladenosine dehydratase